MLVRRKTTAILTSGLLLLGVAACDDGTVESPAGELDTGAEGADNGVQPDDTGPDSVDDPVFGEDEEDAES